MAAAALAGFSRGFAAVGAAMIYIPLVTLAYDARTAVVTMFLVDLLPSLPLVWKAASCCDRRTIGWMALGAVAASPIGVLGLLFASPMQAQLIMGLVLLATASYLLLNRDFRLVPTSLGSLTAGGISGLAGGLCGIFGPPAMIYLLGRDGDVRQSRADIIVYLTGQSLILGGTYLAYGLYTSSYLELSLTLMPIYAMGLWCGASRFAHVGEAAYRRIVLGLLWLIAIFLIGEAAFSLF
ncbi:sulfite exporter TauE/SafE family protein [Labrys sp. LIt4]|uniref:sulfite exporter TauE/SafE family protein n=1 Tax=Labrys sp. LIt4 TaxID=2821355 RepID=UPI002474D3F5|nr:sulfite exporter TauE/SafE family protein [Labrys sp. LIt4]